MKLRLPNGNVVEDGRTIHVPEVPVVRIKNVNLRTNYLAACITVVLYG
jgi:hypothetical protein